MYSASDFEKLWFLYKTEGEPNGISINSFCVTHGVSYTHCNDWFRKTHNKIVPVQIDGKPSEECEVSEPVKEDIKKTSHSKGNIMVSIQTREGLQIRKKNLSYQELKSLVEKLEGLC